MRNIVEYINKNLNEAFNENTRVFMADSAELEKWLKSEIENFDGKLKVDGEGVKVNNLLVPGTGLGKKPTAGEIADKVVDYLIKKKIVDERSMKNIKYKKLRKNTGVKRGGSTNTKEYWDKKRAAANDRIVKGTDREINKDYFNK